MRQTPDRSGPFRLALAGPVDQIARIASAATPFRLGRLILIAPAPAESAALSTQFPGVAEPGRDLMAASGADMLILATGEPGSFDAPTAAACLARLEGSPVILVAGLESNVTAAALLRASRVEAARLIAVGGVADQRARAAKLAASLGVSRSQVSLLVAGSEGRGAMTLARHTTIAGIPASILRDALGIPNSPFEPLHADASPSAGAPCPSPGAVAEAAARIAAAIAFDRRRIHCAGAYFEADAGLPGGFLSRPVILGRKGVVARFDAPLTLAERSFMQREAGRMAEALAALCQKSCGALNVT